MGLVCPGPRVGAFFVHAQVDNSPLETSPRAVQALSRLPASATTCRASAFDQLFVSHFIDSFGLPRNTHEGPTWLEILPSFLGVEGNALATASIRSASMLSYGTWVRDEAIQADSYRWYASALTHLSRSIAKVKQPVATVEMAVCAAVMLIHFETGAGTSRNAWVHHVKGAASLLEAVGPTACQNGFLQSVFSHLRFQVFIATMQENTLHVFAEDDWLDIPFRVRNKTFFDELVDGLFATQECLYKIQQANGNDVAATPNVAIKGLLMKTSCQLADWDTKYIGFLRRELLVNSTNITTAESHDTNLAFSGLPEAALVSLFHAARLVVSRLGAAIGADTPDTALQDTSIILAAASFINDQGSGPDNKLRPFMVLPGLKIASLWSPLPSTRAAACTLLLDRKFLESPMAELAQTQDGFFASLATSLTL